MLAMNPTITTMLMCQRRLAIEIMKHQVRIGSYNLQSYAGAKKEGCLQLSVLVEELEGMGIGLCGLQELHWPRVKECGAKGRGRWAFVGYKSSVGHVLGSVTSLYHLACRASRGRGLEACVV